MRANLADYPPVTILHAAAARIALHEADQPRARNELTWAQRLRPGLTNALPHLAVQARIELARCHLALSDFSVPRTLLREAEGIFRGDADAASSCAASHFHLIGAMTCGAAAAMVEL